MPSQPDPKPELSLNTEILTSGSPAKAADALQFRPNYAKGLYFSSSAVADSWRYYGAKPVSSWPAARLQQWLSFEASLALIRLATLLGLAAIVRSPWLSRTGLVLQGIPPKVREVFANWSIDGAVFLLLTLSTLQSTLQLEPECAQLVWEARSALDRGPELGIW